MGASLVAINSIRCIAIDCHRILYTQVTRVPNLSV